MTQFVQQETEQTFTLLHHTTESLNMHDLRNEYFLHEYTEFLHLCL